MTCLCGCRAEEHDEKGGACQSIIGKWRCPCIRYRQACEDRPRRPIQLDYDGSWYRAANPETDFDSYCAQMYALNLWPEGVPVGPNHHIYYPKPSSKVH